MDDRRTEYLKNAEECRALARLAPLDQQQGLIKMAETWEKLAAQRDPPVDQEPENTD